MLIKVIEPVVYLVIIVNLVIAISYKRKSKKTPVKVVAPIVILEKKEAIIQKNDRHVEQVNLFVRIKYFLFGHNRVSRDRKKYVHIYSSNLQSAFCCAP